MKLKQKKVKLAGIFMKEVVLNDLLLRTMSRRSPQCFSECDTVTTCSCTLNIVALFGPVP